MVLFGVLVLVVSEAEFMVVPVATPEVSKVLVQLEYFILVFTQS